MPSTVIQLPTEDRLETIEKKIRIDFEILKDKLELLAHLRTTPIKEWTADHRDAFARLERK